MIAYASYTLSKSEKNYDAHKLEFLALNGLLLKDSMSICMMDILRYIQTTTL